MAATSPKSPQVLVIDGLDNVATTLGRLSAGCELIIERRGSTLRLLLRDEIPMGHKFALEAIGQGESVRKYGVVIARATVPIGAGEHVHVHNVESNRGRGDRA